MVGLKYYLHVNYTISMLCRNSFLLVKLAKYFSGKKPKRGLFRETVMTRPGMGARNAGEEEVN